MDSSLLNNRNIKLFVPSIIIYIMLCNLIINPLYNIKSNLL
jgi:hypothetical protein